MRIDRETLLDPEVPLANLVRLARALGVSRPESLTRKRLAYLVLLKMNTLRRRPAGTVPGVLATRKKPTTPPTSATLALPLVAPGPSGAFEALADGPYVCPCCRRPIREIEDHHGWCVEGIRQIALLG